MKLLIVLLMSILTAGLARAEQLTLTDIAALKTKAPITQGSFQQTKQLKVLRKPLLSNGEFTYDQSKGVIWKTLKPMKSLLLVNGSKLLTGQAQQAVPAAFGKVFTALLGNNIEQLQEGFEASALGPAARWRVQLIPKDAFLKKIISKMTLLGDTELRSLEIIEASGNSTQIQFDNINHPLTLTPEQIADFERLSP